MARARAGSLGLRIASALVLAPVALAAVWLGPPYLSALVIAAAAGMAWEWARLCRGGRIDTAGWVVIAAVIGGVAAASVAALAVAGIVVLLGCALVFAIGGPGQAPVFAALGILWIAVPCIGLLWLASDPATGRATVLWILAVVWATDIGAYAVGRTLGGPRLAPRMSPNKTWSGLAGGVVCAMAAGVATASLVEVPVLSALPLLSGALAIVAQSGDLAESVAKRHFGVKDSSGLIPGHGGLLDRLDGMLAVVPAVALLSLIGGGSVVAWR